MPGLRRLQGQDQSFRGDKPTEHALAAIRACRNAEPLASWQRRAYQGETSDQLFPEPVPPAN